MKTFERVLHKRLVACFSPLLAKSQHGFVAKRSTTTNLACFTSFIAEELDKSNDVHAIYTDFSKAFDRVNPEILIAKLSSFGVRGSLLNWFKDYLTGRSSYVVAIQWQQLSRIHTTSRSTTGFHSRSAVIPRLHKRSP